LVNPQLTARYEVGNENSITANLNTRNNFGNIQTLYKGFIVQNYRSIDANNGELSQFKTRSVNVGFNFRKSAKLFYTNFLVTYSAIRFNTITNIYTTATGDRKFLLPLQNTAKNLSLNIGVSKYIFKLGILINAKYFVQNSSIYQLLNNNLQPYKNTTTAFNFSASYKKNSRFSIVYSGNLTKNVSKQSKVTDEQKQQLFQMQQMLDYYYFPTKKIITTISLQQFYSSNITTKNKTNVFFADLSIRYKLNKLKTDLELSCTNILNVKEFYNYLLLTNYLSETRVYLNPRILLAKVFINF
jgi:hypothetical protein